MGGSLSKEHSKLSHRKLIKVSNCKRLGNLDFDCGFWILAVATIPHSKTNDLSITKAGK